MTIPDEANRDALAAEEHLKRNFPELSEVRFGGWEDGPGGQWAFKRAENALALLVFAPDIGVQEVHGGIAKAWILSGGPDGPLGLPTTWEEGSWEERWGNFQTGKIRWTRDCNQIVIFTPDPPAEIGNVVLTGLSWPSAPENHRQRSICMKWA